MDAEYEFSLNGPNMDFALNRIREGHLIPANLFIDIMTEKCQLINKYLRSIRDCLLIVASVTNNKASIQFHDIHYIDSEMHCVTLSNMPDLEDQLIYLWTEIREFLRYFHLEDHEAELASIDSFYIDLVYNELVQANFMDF